MKRGTKRCLFAAAVLAVLGVALCTAALAKVNFDITRLSVPSDEEREARDFSFDPAGVERIVIQTGLDNVKLLPSADGQIHLRCFSGGGMVYDASVDGGELAVRQRQEGTRKLPPWFQFDLIGRNHGKELSLSIPKGFDGDLVLELDAGAVEITDGVEIAGAVDAILSLGGFSAENLSARSLTVKCSAGDVSGREWKIGQYAFLTASLGRISLEDSAVGSTLSCSADLGDISISDVSAQETLFHAGAGRIEFSRLAAEQIQADADLGDIKGSVLGEETEYSIDAGADLGSCDLTNRWGTGDKTLRVSCGAGDIRVCFLPGP